MSRIAQINLRVRPSLKAKLEKLAKQDRRTLSAYVEKLLEADCSATSSLPFRGRIFRLALLDIPRRPAKLWPVVGYALRAIVTPEMLSYFSEQLADNASRGLINRVTDVKLLQGDLAEAWREGRTDYATVAMNYALKDSMVERASGRTVEGGERTEVTELWTFMRSRGGNWMLSAIQQT